MEFRVNQQLFDGLEKFACFLYGFPKKSTVNDVRKSIFWTKFDKEKKVVDLNVLLPCKNNLKYHIIRSNYVSYIFRHANQLVLILKRLKITDGMKKVKSVGAMNVIQRRYQIFFLRKNTVVRIHLVIMMTANHILKMISTIM